jgi:CHASE2 domain-containing sensor protein
MRSSNKRAGKARSRPASVRGASAHEAHDSTTTILTGFLIGLIFTIALLAANRIFEQTAWGQEILSMSYNLLQRQLSSGAAVEDLPVIIVDINDLEVDTNSQATPRNALRALIEQILKQNPKAIGIDLDFSPDEHGYITQDDPDFFDYCLALQDKQNTLNHPVFLGIWRSQANPPEEWLGAEDYKDLAASVMIPKSDARKMVKWTAGESSREICPTMATALASTLKQPNSNIPSWLAWAAESVSETELSPDLRAGEFLVDYSRLETLQKERLHTKNPDVIADQGRLLHNRIVLVGDGTTGAQGDNFVVPGHRETTPGVYFHACAAYTLAEAPLYELTLRGRLAIDILLSILVIGSVAGLRLRYINATQTVAAHRLHRVFTFVIVVAAFVVGYMFVSKTRIFWDDFVLVIIALLLHPTVEDKVIKLAGWLRAVIPAAWRKLVFEREKEEGQ